MCCVKVKIGDEMCVGDAASGFLEADGEHCGDAGGGRPDCGISSVVLLHGRRPLRVCALTLPSSVVP